MIFFCFSAFSLQPSACIGLFENQIKVLHMSIRVHPWFKIFGGSRRLRALRLFVVKGVIVISWRHPCPSVSISVHPWFKILVFRLYLQQTLGGSRRLRALSFHYLAFIVFWRKLFSIFSISPRSLRLCGESFAALLHRCPSAVQNPLFSRCIHR